MKFATWNVNGFRAVLKKGFEDFFYDTDADIFCSRDRRILRRRGITAISTAQRKKAIRVQLYLLKKNLLPLPLE